MPYHLEDPKLRVVHAYAREPGSQRALSTCRLIVLEHILPTTEEFLRHLREGGAEVFAVIGKPYSIDEPTWKRLETDGFNLIRKSYDDLEESDFLDELIAQAVETSRGDGKQVVILEVGGYFAKPLTRLPPENAQWIAGVVEDTTFGHNRYSEAISDIPVPVFSVARSALKEVEARFVGHDAVSAIETTLRELGVSLPGRRALVLGYGMIGSSVARALRAQNLHVSVYDLHDFKNLHAFVDGFSIHKRRTLLVEADIVFAATASVALEWQDIEDCKDNVILASVGSKDTEFDIKTLKAKAVRADELSPYLTRYVLTNSKNIVVARDGTAVNFLLPSTLPVEVLDLVFAEVLLCTLKLIRQQDAYIPGVLYESSEDSLNRISKDWLRSVNVS